ncbi:MAG: hypothetical protein ACC634_01915 [Hyphomicrobiales bacterium]
MMIMRLLLAGVLFVGGGLVLWPQWLLAGAATARSQALDPLLSQAAIGALKSNPLAGRIIFEEIALALTANALSASKAGQFRLAAEQATRARNIFHMAIARAPIAPGAWAALALANLQLAGVTPTTIAALGRSYATGPRQGWLAPRRVKLALLTWRLLAPGIRAAAIRDIAQMSTTIAGAGDLAKIYLELRPVALRAPLLSALITTDKINQRRFLGAVRERSAAGVLTF